MLLNYLNIMSCRLKICTWNARGVEKKSQGLLKMVNDNHIDICLLTETKLADATEFRVEGYHLYRACHPYDMRRGGSGVLIKLGISHEKLESITINCRHNIDNTNSHMVCLQVARIGLLVDGVTYQIGSFYAPSGHAVSSDDFKRVFQEMGSHFLLGGDFNGHHSSWNLNSPRANAAGRRLHTAIEQEKLEIMAPMFYTNIPDQIGHQASILDFFIGKNVKYMCSTPTVLGESKSDHMPVLMEMGRASSTPAQHSGPVQDSLRSDLIPRPCQPLQMEDTSAVWPYLDDCSSASTQDLAIVPPVDSSSASKQNSLLRPPVDNIPASTSILKASNTLRIITWEGQGLEGKEHEVFQFAGDTDILMISNTHLFPESLVIPGYAIYKAFHPSSDNEGGSAILVRKSVSHVELPSIVKGFVQIARVAIAIDSKIFVLGSLYFSPEHNYLPTDIYLEVFDNFGSSSGFMIGGGFNAKHLNWACTVSDDLGGKLSRVIDVLNLEMLVPSLPTFYSSTESRSECMDFFVGKFLPPVVRSPELCCDSSSEHKPVRVELKIR